MKTLGQDRQSRRRTIVVFLGAVVLPSLILAYVGMRYIRQEEQWQGRLVVQNLETALSNAAREVEGDVGRHVHEVFDSLTSRTSLPTVIIPLELHTFSREHSLVEEILILDNNGNLLFPRSFRLRGSRIGTFVASATLTEHLVKGEQYEARTELREALEEFTKGLERSGAARQRLAFRIRIARCLYRTGALNEAQQVYHQVLLEDGHHFWGEELPYRIVALSQLAEIAGRLGKPMEALDNLSTAYRDILTEFHRFDRSTYEYHRRRLQNVLASYGKPMAASISDRLESVSRIEEPLRSEPARGEFFKRHVLPSITSLLRTRPQPNTVRYTTVDVPDTSLHFAFLYMSDNTRSLGMIGIWLRTSSLIEFMLEALPRFSVGENIRVALLDRNSVPVGPGEEPGATVVLEETLNILAGTMQGYRLAIVGMPGTSVEDITSRPLTLYYVLIGIVILVILLGMLFIYHETSRERELVRMKSDFISNVTHEIKTPIATIHTLAENVNEGWVRASDRHEHYFRLIARESERLGHLVENTLDFARVESGRKRYRKEVGSPREVIENTVERFRTLTDGHGVEISCSIHGPLPLISMDEGAIGQAIMNLLDNAVKYSRERKIVTLTATVKRDQLLIAVTDAGIGMDKKEISRIFEKFYRSEPSAGRKVTGSGIGLTLVKDIVEAHGGHIEVVSERNKGSTFTIILPVA